MKTSRNLGQVPNESYLSQWGSLPGLLKIVRAWNGRGAASYQRQSHAAPLRFAIRTERSSRTQHLWTRRPLVQDGTVRRCRAGAIFLLPHNCMPRRWESQRSGAIPVGGFAPIATSLTRVTKSGKDRPRIFLHGVLDREEGASQAIQGERPANSTWRRENKTWPITVGARGRLAVPPARFQPSRGPTLRTPRPLGPS